MLTFFGLNFNDRLNIFAQIHEIVFHGQGGYDWETVYNMPLWLRRFTFNKMKEWYDAQSAEQNKYLINEENPASQAKIPDIVQKLSQAPTYQTKTSKKK